MELVLAGGVGDKTECKSVACLLARETEWSYLSSSPPNLRTMFRKENTVPNTSFASSSVERTVWPRPARSDPEREPLPASEVGRGSQRRL
jgi:hypothetical protein